MFNISQQNNLIFTKIPLNNFPYWELKFIFVKIFTIESYCKGNIA